VEECPAGDEELERYREAGAWAVMRYRFPRKHAGQDSFFFTEMMEDPSDTVLLEGPRPLPHTDLSVYVAEPPSDDGDLLEWRMRDRAREVEEELDVFEGWLEEPDGVRKFMEHFAGKEIGSLASRFPDKAEELGKELAKALEAARQAPPPAPTQHWAVRPGYEGIEWAQVVVVNVRDETRRKAAETLVSDLKRLREDEDVFQDVLAPLGNRTPITAAAADLSDPRDPGTRKILTRIRRSMRGR
jgi:hypothetical protein